jgi:hypothetical protein
MQGAEECRLRRISNTPQGEATEGNAADDTLMVDQGQLIATIHIEDTYIFDFTGVRLSFKGNNITT